MSLLAHASAASASTSPLARLKDFSSTSIATSTCRTPSVELTSKLRAQLPKLSNALSPWHVLMHFSKFLSDDLAPAINYIPPGA